MAKVIDFRNRLISNVGTSPHLLVGPSVGFLTTLNLSCPICKMGIITAGLTGLSRLKERWVQKAWHRQVPGPQGASKWKVGR